MRDALSGIFDVADPSGIVTLAIPAWVSGYHSPLITLTKYAIHANRDDTYDLHRFVYLFAKLHERMTKGASGSAAFKVLLTELADYFDPAPRGAALETFRRPHQNALFSLPSFV